MKINKDWSETRIFMSRVILSYFCVIDEKLWESSGKEKVNLTSRFSSARNVSNSGTRVLQYLRELHVARKCARFLSSSVDGNVTSPCLLELATADVGNWRRPSFPNKLKHRRNFGSGTDFELSFGEVSSPICGTYRWQSRSFCFWSFSKIHHFLISPGSRNATTIIFQMGSQRMNQVCRTEKVRGALIWSLKPKCGEPNDVYRLPFFDFPGGQKKVHNLWVHQRYPWLFVHKNLTDTIKSPTLGW